MHAKKREWRCLCLWLKQQNRLSLSHKPQSELASAASQSPEALRKCNIRASHCSFLRGRMLFSWTPASHSHSSRNMYLWPNATSLEQLECSRCWFNVLLWSNFKGEEGKELLNDQFTQLCIRIHTCNMTVLILSCVFIFVFPLARNMPIFKIWAVLMSACHVKWDPNPNLNLKVFKLVMFNFLTKRCLR